MPDYVKVAFRSYTNDRQVTGFRVIAGATALQRTDLVDAIQGVSVGGNDGAWHEDELEPPTGVAATSPVAAPKLRAIAEMVDSVNGRTYKEFIPMPDVTIAAAWVKDAGVTTLDEAHALFTALETAANAIWESPEGNAGTLQRVYIEE